MVLCPEGAHSLKKDMKEAPTALKRCLAGVKKASCSPSPHTKYTVREHPFKGYFTGLQIQILFFLLYLFRNQSPCISSSFAQTGPLCCFASGGVCMGADQRIVANRNGTCTVVPQKNISRSQHTHTQQGFLRPMPLCRDNVQFITSN